MTLGDTRGRLRLNLIDGLAAALIIVLVPLGFAAYRIFRIPPPHVTAVEPATLEWKGDRRLHVTGDHFIPYLRAFFTKKGEPLQIISRDPSAQQGRFLIESPSSFELAVPPEMEPGTYDMYLFDETAEVARVPSAFTIAAPRMVDADLEVRVRFVVSPELASLIRAGDLDTPAPRPFPKQEARITAAQIAGEPANKLELLPADGQHYFGTVVPSSVVIAIVRVNARSFDGLWRYQDQTLRAGDLLRFRTNDYTTQGQILGVKRVQ
jgi:hypothetical protein